MKKINPTLIIIIITLIFHQCNNQEMSNDSNSSKESIVDLLCKTKNCISCNKKKECNKCKPNYVLFNKRCYLNECELYGECSYCTEFDCVQCHQGFKVKYGFCEEESFFSNKHNILLVVALSIILLSIIMIVFYICKKRLRQKNNERELISAHHLTSKRLSGQYIIINPQNNNFIFNSITNSNPQLTHSNSFHSMKGNEQGLNPIEMINNTNPNSNEMSSINNANKATKGKVKGKRTQASFYNLNDISHSDYTDSASKRTNPLNTCAICHSTKLHSFAICGCGLCLKDYNKIVKKNKKYICYLHKTVIQEGYLFMKEKTILIPSNDEEDDNDSGNSNNSKSKDEGICPICKISPGVFGFNCGCPLLLCAKCFNDNMNMYKIRQCPGCKAEYKDNKK